MLWGLNKTWSVKMLKLSSVDWARATGHLEAGMDGSTLRCQSECNELGEGRPRLETGATDDGLSGFPKEHRHNPVMV